MIFFGGVGAAVVAQKQGVATEEIPTNREKHKIKRKIISAGPPIFCKMVLIFGQKWTLILRVVCKLLPLCGLARTTEG
jgi:hypothetical protein